MRLLRGQVPRVLDDYGYHFKWGQAQVLRSGRDVLIIATGLLTMRALESAQALAGDSVDVAVLHVPSLKPMDEKTIIKPKTKKGIVSFQGRQKTRLTTHVRTRCK